MQPSNKSKPAPKITWGELRQLMQQAGVQDDDEIDCIEISWGTADQLNFVRDEDFGWQIRQSC